MSFIVIMRICMPANRPITLGLVASSLNNGRGTYCGGPDYSPQNKISKVSFCSHRFNHGDLYVRISELSVPDFPRRCSVA